MYRPNFCADCGERIYRKRWLPWTSRCFCAKCATRLRRATVFVPFFGILALVIAAWLAGHSARPDPPPLIIEQATLPAHNLSANSLATTNTTEGDTPPSPIAPKLLARDTPHETLTDPAEIVSICGARTKKGTPCSRRVRGVGRCWQHRGKSAMLPAGKLRISE